eukprot:350551-Chlamydomonas_euryale.AAC.5
MTFPPSPVLTGEQNNQFKSRLPEQPNWQQLHILHGQSSGMYGTLPAAMSEARLLADINLASNNLSGAPAGRQQPCVKHPVWCACWQTTALRQTPCLVGVAALPRLLPRCCFGVVVIPRGSASHSADDVKAWLRVCVAQRRWCANLVPTVNRPGLPCWRSTFAGGKEASTAGWQVREGTRGARQKRVPCSLPATRACHPAVPASHPPACHPCLPPCRTCLPPTRLPPVLATLPYLPPTHPAASSASRLCCSACPTPARRFPALRPDPRAAGAQLGLPHQPRPAQQFSQPEPGPGHLLLPGRPHLSLPLPQRLHGYAASQHGHGALALHRGHI